MASEGTEDFVTENTRQSVPAGSDEAPFVDGDGPVVAGDDDGVDEHVAEADRRMRSVGVAAIAGIVIAITALVVINNLPEVGELNARSMTARDSVLNNVPPISAPALVMSRLSIRDTVYTTDSVYLDLNLAKQHVTVRFRNGNTRGFRVSSGSPYVSEGIATPVGLFTVQNQMPMAISKQFNNARLHHWIGIQGGVGFHGLDGNGYYGYLGVRPSSHGCVRMAREEIADMYKLVHPGALIMVHYGNPARVVAFCDPRDTANADLIDSAAVYNRALGRDRMRVLYDGRYWLERPRRLVHIANQRVRWGLEIGDAKRIPRQEVPPVSYISGVGRAMRAVWRPDRSSVENMRAEVYNNMRRAADSVARARAAERKNQDNPDSIEFGE